MFLTECGMITKESLKQTLLSIGGNEKNLKASN